MGTLLSGAIAATSLLALAATGHAQVTAKITTGLYGIQSGTASGVHVFAFREDVFRFDDLGRSRDYARSPDDWGMHGGHQPFRGPLAGPPVYGPEVFARGQVVRLRVVLELGDPTVASEAPAHLVVRLRGTDGAVHVVRARRRPGTGRGQGIGGGSDESARELGLFAHAEGTLVNGKMYRLPMEAGQSRVAWAPVYEATVDLGDVYHRSARSVAESFAVLGHTEERPDAMGEALAGALGNTGAGAPSQQDAESDLQAWVKNDAEGRPRKHRRGHKTAAVIPFVVETPDGTRLLGGPGAEDDELTRARLTVRHVPDWLFLGCGGDEPRLSAKDFVGSSLEGAVEVLMLGPCDLIDDAKEDFPTTEGPNRFYLERPAGYWWWRVSRSTVVGFRTPPAQAAAQAAARAFVAATAAVKPPEPPPPGKDWQHPDHLPAWKGYSRQLAAAWVQAAAASGADGAAIDVEGDLYTADGALPRAAWEPQGTGFVGLQIYETIVYDDATREAERRGERVVQVTDRQQGALRRQIPEVQQVRRELIETFRSRPPETLELLFDQDSYRTLSERLHAGEAARLRAGGASYTESRREQYEVALRLAFSKYVLSMEREIYRDFGRIDTEHSGLDPVGRAIYLATHNSSKIGYRFPEAGDSFEAAVARAYGTLSPPYEAGARSYLGPLEDRTDERAQEARVRIQRGILRAYLESRFETDGRRGLGEFLGAGNRSELVAFLASPQGRPLLGTVAKHDPELAKQALRG